MAKQSFTPDTKEKIVHDYSTDKYQTLSGLARKFGCSIGKIRKLLVSKNVAIRSASEAQTKRSTFEKEDHKRFWNNVNKGADHECWGWLASSDSCGYGRFRFRSKLLSAHRVSWEIHNGKIPNGLHILHKCDNPNCVNPNHLSLGTHQDNMNDRGAKKRTSGGNLKGEANKASRFSESDIITMRDLAKQGVKQKEIASQFGTTQPVISNIINHKYWTHI